MKNKIPTTDIAFILDRSGSMAPLTEAAIAGFNEFLHDQQQAEGQAWLTLVLFDDEYLVPVDHLPVSEVVELDATTYVPRSCTALLDAIGQTIARFDERIASLPEAKRPDKVVFAIFTDGLENSSVEYTWKQISQMIRKHRKEDGWEFLFLAANQDAVATASQMSINVHDAATWDATATGAVASSKAFSRKDPGHADAGKRAWRRSFQIDERTAGRGNGRQIGGRGDLRFLLRIDPPMNVTRGDHQITIPAPSPNPSHPVSLEAPVAADDLEIFLQRLGNQHPVEGVPVMKGKFLDAATMPGQDAQFDDAVFRQVRGKRLVPVTRNLQIAKPAGGKLQSDFPETDDGKKQLVGFVERLCPSRRESGRMVGEPNQGVGVDQRTFHHGLESALFMKSRSISASRSESEVKRSTTPRGIVPARNPAFRFGRSRAAGTSRATGLSRRAITTSSPRSTAAIKRESCVLASWMVTCMG